MCNYLASNGIITFQYLLFKCVKIFVRHQNDCVIDITKRKRCNGSDGSDGKAVDTGLKGPGFKLPASFI